MLILNILLYDSTHSFAIHLYSFPLVHSVLHSFTNCLLWVLRSYTYDSGNKKRNCLPRQTGNWICSWGRPWILQGGKLLLLFLNCLHSVKFRKFPAVGYKKMTKFLEKQNNAWKLLATQAKFLFIYNLLILLLFRCHMHMAYITLYYGKYTLV